MLIVSGILDGDNFSLLLKNKNEVKPLTGFYLIGLQDDLSKRRTGFAKAD
jgi:hypothetical protein